jgi:hypothetical protein
MSAWFSHDGKRTVYLEYHFENLKDHVTTVDVKEYMDGLDIRDKEFSYVLSYSVDGKPFVLSSETNNKKENDYFYIGLLTLLVIGGIVWWTQRK